MSVPEKSQRELELERMLVQQQQLIQLQQMNQAAQVANVQRSGLNPGVAAILSLLIPGLGQMCKGQAAIGIVWFLCVVGGYFMFIFPGLILHLICIVTAASSK